MSIKRYTGKFTECVYDPNAMDSPHWEHPCGDWVKWSDYDKLQSDYDRLLAYCYSLEEHIKEENKDG